jgi:probable F420-dependent oxidoreductase
VQVVAGMDPQMALTDVGPYARRVEAIGYDVLHVPETIHDGFAVALLALEHTETITVRTSVALAFVRSPMLTAYTAWDLQRFSRGRFELGLGTQIRPNIEDRFGMPWTEPVTRMREYVGAVRAAFHAFRTGARPQFRGDSYRVTRLQPYFNPGPIDETDPPLWLGGVNVGMCTLAGELADGFVTHPTSSNERYLNAICRPALAEGQARLGRAPGAVPVVVGTPLITGADDAAVALERERQRSMLGFLYSTPAYRRTLELYGWADIGERLQRMTREGAWDRLNELISDEMLDALLPQATYAELAGVLRQRLGGLADGVIIPPPTDRADDELMAGVVAALRRDE